MTDVKGFSDRSYALDALRAIAVIMVVLFHVATRIPFEALDPVARLFLRYGFLGVDIFFPLSGFLITSFLIRPGKEPDIRSFFIRRVFRIVPLYMVAVTIFVVAAVASGIQADALGHIWVTYAMLTGWFTFSYGTEAIPYTITWSISVEEFAYVLFGIAAAAVRSRFTFFLLVLLVFPFILRIWLFSAGYPDIYYFPPARLDSIAAGGLVAVLMNRYRHAWVVFAALSLVALVARFFGNESLSFASLFSVVTFLSCIAIAVCAGFLSHLRGRLMGALATIGLYSYFIYLMHFFVIYFLMIVFRKLGFGAQNFWLMSAATIGVSVLIAHFSFKYFEAPLIRLGRQLGSRPKAALSSGGMG